MPCSDRLQFHRPPRSGSLGNESSAKTRSFSEEELLTRSKGAQRRMLRIVVTLSQVNVLQLKQCRHCQKPLRYLVQYFAGNLQKGRQTLLRESVNSRASQSLSSGALDLNGGCGRAAEPTGAMRLRKTHVTLLGKLQQHTTMLEVNG
jgi:hypothetical protein